MQRTSLSNHLYFNERGESSVSKSQVEGPPKKEPHIREEEVVTSPDHKKQDRFPDNVVNYWELASYN